MATALTRLPLSELKLMTMRGIEVLIHNAFELLPAQRGNGLPM